jgi:hypothetical protein
MSLAYYIVLNNDDPGFETFVNGKALAHAIAEIDAICERDGIDKVDEFMGQSAGEFADMLGEAIDFPEDERGDAAWFEPDAGVAMVDAIAQSICANPKALRSPEAVLAELSEYRRVLVQAKSIGAKWHLAIDI